MTDAALFAPPAPAPAAQACAHCGEALRGANDALFCCAGCASAHAIIGAAGLGSFYRRLEENARPPARCRSTPISRAMPGRPEPARPSSTCWSKASTAPACVWLLESLLARNPGDPRAPAPISRRDACRCAGAERPATPTAMSAWWRRSASAWRRTTSSPPRPTTTARRASCCAAWPSRASPPPTSCCSRSPSGRATTARWAMPRAPSSTGCPPRSPCRRSPMPAARSSARPSRRCRAGRTNMDVPISIGVTLACIVSLHEAWVGEQHAYFDSAITLLFFLLIGRYLDRRARGRARHAVRALLALASRSAHGRGGRRHGRLASGRPAGAGRRRCWWRAGERAGRRRRRERRRLGARCRPDQRRERAGLGRTRRQGRSPAWSISARRSACA